MKKAAFFDRDGTINVDIGYLHENDKLVFIPGIPELIKDYNKKGYLVIVITNQSGIARGMYTEEEMFSLHEEMNRQLSEIGAHIDKFYFCPHLSSISGECTCRKPAPGLFLQAIKEFGIDPRFSVSYGDSERDEEASRAAGINTNYQVKPDGTIEETIKEPDTEKSIKDVLDLKITNEFHPGRV